MSIETLQMMSTVSMIISIMFLVVSALLFFRFDMADVFGYFSGSTKRKEIKVIENQARSGEKRKIEPEGDKKKQKKKIKGKILSNKTSKLSTDSLMKEAHETTLLEQPTIETIATTKLDESKISNSKTSVMETTLLVQEDEISDFHIDFEIGFAESLDIIE